MLSVKNYILLLVLMAMLTTACSNSKHLPPGESLFKGSKVHIVDNEIGAKEKKLLRNDLAGLVRPKTNSKTLGMRLKLTMYNLAGDTKKTKGIRRWLRTKVGEPPVLTSTVNLNTNKEIMVNFLQNRGLFNAKSSAHFDTTKKRKATAVFDITTGPQYRINEVMLRKDSTPISKAITRRFNKTMLTPGSSYNLDVIKAERVRIDNSLKNKGYFYFKPDYILVIADTSIGDHKVNMYVKLKSREIPEEAYKAYSINDIYIYANYRLRGKRQDTGKDEIVVYDNYKIIDKKKTYNPRLFSEAMIFEKGDLYSLRDQNKSLSRLVNLGTFKFVKNRFEPVSDTMLDVYYYLTPYPKKSLRFEIGAITQNDNRAGSKGSVSWRNRNTFKGAEELMFKINGGFESQYSGVVKLPNIYNFGLEANLATPRFVVPFIDIQTSSQFLPRSIIKLKYNFESETDLLRINSYTASYGYDWKENTRKSHQFYPVNFTYVKTDTLGNPENLDLLYGNLFFNGIIVGPTYQFTYNSQRNNSPRKHSIYFDGLIDLSGNILGILQKADYESNPKTLFGNTYAQYIKLQPDFRYYFRISNATIVATRVLAGLGIPYGNSSQLPNIKQFWAGGNSDLRGFPSRLVGPGTFNGVNINQSTSYIETLGDIKAEFNLELRQHVYKFINVGVFSDVGNIWQYRANPAFPGGQFTSDFYKQLAVDAGFGFRFDFKILILRLDLAMPLRKPWYPENDRWVIDEIHLSDPTWKKNNLVFNIAIGYPF